MNAGRLALPACALIGMLGIATGCGGMPGNAVAEVDGETIEREALDHWLAIAAKQGGGTDVDDATLRRQVLDVLLSHAWIRGEAEEMGVEVSDDEVRKRYDEQREQTFPRDAAFRRFLRQSGQSEEDLLLQVRLELLSTKISQKVAEEGADVTDAQVDAFYEENRERFAQPERRDLRIVLTRTRARAEQARRALQGGASWRSVARRHSTDEASAQQGGKLPAQAEGTLDPALDKVVFAARRGRVSGPVRTRSGHYVFVVEKVQPAAQQTLEQARETIRQTLRTQNEQKAVDAFAKDFQERWRERTECREGYETTQCDNGPRPTPTPTPGAPSPGESG